MEKYLYIALFAPLVGSMFAALFGARPKTVIAGLVPSTLLLISLIASSVLLVHIIGGGEVIHVEMMTWMATGNLYIPFGFIVDQVSVTMMMVVTLVSTVVHFYGDLTGQMFAFFVIAIAASEVAVGLGLLIVWHKRHSNIDLDALSTMKG